MRSNALCGHHYETDEREKTLRRRQRRKQRAKLARNKTRRGEKKKQALRTTIALRKEANETVASVSVFSVRESKA